MREVKFRMYSKGRGKILSWEELQCLHVHTVFKMLSPECYLMQYTGLKDKNGVEIYEGDLIEIGSNKNGAAEVKFINAYVGGWNLVNGESSCSLGARNSSDIEVVGNIHQNPELLT